MLHGPSRTRAAAGVFSVALRIAPIPASVEPNGRSRSVAAAAANQKQQKAARAAAAPSQAAQEELENREKAQALTAFRAEVAKARKHLENMLSEETRLAQAAAPTHGRALV